MRNLDILYDGNPITVGYAKAITRKYADQACWDQLELAAIWTRLLDAAEEHEERLECAELVTRLTQERLEILLQEPDEIRRESPAA